MEVGAVKQAFNNEVILLKKKLNQAKIQIIHKLTRKAKTMTEKKAPEKLKSKYNKKAESAVKEVLIIKKIKPRDIARFIVTHKGQLNEYLNRPTVDNDKACARLLLHKALLDKYKLIRERFSNIPIKDLLMSRQERRKLKKEEKGKQKTMNKNKQQSEHVQTEGDWDVEDINMDASQVEDHESEGDSKSSNEEHDQDNEGSDASSDGNGQSDSGNESSDDESSDVKLRPNLKHLLNKDNEKVVDDYKESNDSDYGVELNDKYDNGSGGTFVKVSPTLPDNNIIVTNSKLNRKNIKMDDGTNKKKMVDKHKDSHKNKNLNQKILTKKFNKEIPVVTLQENKVVDSFFITASGENYMTLAEPRQPDEIKEEHRQGNRKYRRAVMFGHVPKAKTRRDDFRLENDNKRFSRFDNNNTKDNTKTSFKSNGFERHEFRQRQNQSDDFGKRGDNSNNRNEGKRNIEGSEPEKLHPSWEAKKRQSGILPFQGKKIVFNED